MKSKFLVAVATTSCFLTSGLSLAQDKITGEVNASLRLGLGMNTEPDAELTLDDYGSRIGWMGSADAGKGGLKAISTVEFGFDQEVGVSNTREAWIGVEGDFGTLTGGKQYRAYYDAVTSKVDIAYWNSCFFELACSKESSVIKYTGADKGGVQLMASAVLIPGDEGNDFIDGLDVAATFASGDITIGAGASVLIGNFSDALDLGTGFGAGVSAAMPAAEGTASVSLQYGSADYTGSLDDTIIFTGTFAKDNKYGLVGISSGNNTPFFLTVGMERSIIPDKAFSYFELSAVEPDVDGGDIDLQARAVMVFNLDLLSTGN